MPTNGEEAKSFPATRPAFAWTLAAIAVLWLRHLAASFWLDETGTAWVISEGLGDAITRSGFQGQTPAYYVLAWLNRQLLGSSEVASRIPSLLGMVTASFFVYRIGRRLGNRHAGLLASIVFVSLPQIVFAAADARPYALALAAASGSTLALMRWVEDGDRLSLWLWVVAAVATTYLTYMFALVFLVHGIYLVARRREVRVRGMVPALAVMFLLLLPAIPRALDLITTEDILLWAREGASPRRLLTTIVPLLVVAGTAGGVAAARVMGRVGYERPRLDRKSAILLFTWALAPVLTFFLLGLFLSPKLFQPRYYLLALPGISLAAGWVLGGLTPVRTRAFVALVIVILAGVTYDDERQGRQDWRGAVNAVNNVVERPGTPVLVHTGFATGQSEEQPTESLRRAPVVVYPVEGRVVLLPFDITPETVDTLERIAATRLRGVDRFVLIQSFDVAPFRAWFLQHLDEPDFGTTTIFKRRNLRVDLFVRTTGR